MTIDPIKARDDARREARMKRIEAPTGNYYGGPAVWEEAGKFYIGTENYDGYDKFEISKEFFDAWIREFAFNDWCGND